MHYDFTAIPDADVPQAIEPKRRLPQLAKDTAASWLESRPFFGGLQRERIWVF